MARKPTGRKRPKPADIKAAADRAEKRAKGEKVTKPKADVDPIITPAEEMVVTIKPKKGEKKRRGRKTKYTPALGKALCKMIAANIPLREIAKRPGMPHPSTVLAWASDPKHEFSAQYARAREIQALQIAEETVEISDDGTNDWMERHDKDGKSIGWQLNGEAVARSRLRVDTRKWLLSKVLPKIYGDKVGVEHTGKNGGPIEVSDTSDKMTLARWIAYELASAAKPSDRDGEQVH